MKTKIAKLIQYPRTIYPILRGIVPLHAMYIETIKEYSQLDFKTLIDVGFNEGKYTRAFHLRFPKAKVYAFEPLEDKFEGWQTYEWFENYNIALSDREETADLIVPRGADEQSSFFRMGKNNVGSDRAKDIIKVRCRRFDDMNFEIKSPCLLKIDTEGSELNVLKGMGNTLDKIDVIQLEINFIENYEGQPKLVEILSYLNRFGFNSFIQSSLRQNKNNLDHCDLIFLKEKAQKK